MALRTILQEPDERLRKVSRKVETISPRILQLLDDMKETLAVAKGYGLAAPQVGVLRRIFITDMCDGEGFKEFINPEIILTEGEQTGEEGCLSCGERRGVVTRPAHVVCRALNRDGELVEHDAVGLFARCICHECAHLDGGLFTDLMEIELKPNEFYTEDKGVVTEEEYEQEQS